MLENTYIKRDTSWLSFNHRVLQEAMDESVPLYERIKFLAIYSSNLDEFYRVRVASLRSFKELKKKTRKALDLTVKPKKELKHIRKIVEAQQEQFGKIFREQLLPQLHSHGISLVKDTEYDETQQAFAKRYFFEKVYPNTTPVFFETGQDAPFLENRGLYFLVQFKALQAFAIVNIPTDEHPRFLSLPSVGKEQHPITFLDDLIRYNLEELLGKPIKAAYAIKVSRDAELYIEDEYSGDLVEKIRDSLGARNVGLPTRFLYDSAMPDELLLTLKEAFGLSKHDLIPGGRYHNFNDFFSFPNPTENPALHDAPLPPLPHPTLEGASSIIECLRKKDAVLHFPYQKYDYVPRFILEAAEDPQVKAIKITIYRAAAKSAVVDALLRALDNGKQVVAFIEAKARFDEAANLYWGGELEKKGAKVVYSYPGIKVHSKLLLVEREELGKTHRYAYLGTGNFNEKTARLYCDHALLTADARLTDEVEQIFALLERRILVPKCQHLFVSPFTTRERFEAQIDREIEHAQAGKTAYMILKMNSLEDPGMINKLYEASQAGVDIKLIIRGICCLVSGLEGISERIEVISIVDRFLEHARVYIFANGGEERMYTASADWMTRNIDRRVEAVIPIYDKEVFAEIRHIINLQLQDNTKSRHIIADQSNPYRQLPGAPVRAQLDTYHWLAQKQQALIS
jgi:polyphosphate kinase